MLEKQSSLSSVLPNIMNWLIRYLVEMDFTGLINSNLDYVFGWYTEIWSPLEIKICLFAEMQ